MALLMPRTEGIEVLILLVSLLLTIFIIIQGVKRIHDTDNNGWFILVPIYNLILMLTDGTEGPNNYGEDPKGRAGNKLQHEDGNIGLEKELYPEPAGEQSKLVKAIFTIVIADIAIVLFWVLFNLYCSASGSYEIYSDFKYVITPISIITSVLVPILGAVYTPNRTHKTIFIVCAVLIGLFRILQELGAAM